MRTRAAILAEPGSAVEVLELELASPEPGEVLVRLHASGVCHSDLSVVDGTIVTPLPCVLGHEGAGVVREVGAGVRRVGPGDHVVLSWSPACGSCEECLRGLPQLCTTAWPAMFSGGLLDRTSRLSLDGRTIFHYSLLSSFSEWAVVPEASCVRVSPGTPLDVAALVGCAVTTGFGAVCNTAAVRPGDRVAVFGCGGVGASAILAAAMVGAAPIVAVDRREEKLEQALALGATHAVAWTGTAEQAAEAVLGASGGGVDYAFDAVGGPEVVRGAFLSTRARGATVVIGIPRQDAKLELPLLPIPRQERRILGSIYGSSRPERDFPLILELHRSGRLPLDRLVSHRFPLDGVGEALELVRTGRAVRSVLEMAAS